MGITDAYMVRFEDGPLREVHNLPVARELFGWPLPARLTIVLHPEATKLAIWDPDAELPDLPEVILTSPSAVTYRKVAESQLPDDVPGVIRGATYEMESNN